MKNKILIGIFFSIFLLIASNVQAANFMDNQTVDANKTWTIKFTNDVGLDDVTKQGITVTDSKGNAANVGIEVGQDNKTVIVTAPQGGYTPGESYILNVGTKAHSAKGKALKNEYKVHFIIDSVTTGISDNTDITSKFTDENFKNAVYSLIGKSSSEPILYSDVKSITTLGVYNKNISNLSGIEYFTALTTLNCGSNPLTALDVSKNAALTTLVCFADNLTALDVSKNVALTSLNCQTNKLTTLDVSKNTALTSLTCNYNNLTALNVNAALTILDCSYNNLIKLDVSNDTALTALVCNYNKLATLDASKNASLTGLYCLENNLTTLDLSKNAALDDLNCSYNELKTLYSITDTWDTTDYRTQYTDSTHTTTTDSLVITIKRDSGDSNSDSDILKFKDKNLEKVVRDAINKPIGNIYKSDVENITGLMATLGEIKDITGIQSLNNLKYFTLYGTQVSDISALKGLTNLQSLDLRMNQISDISSLSGLTNLQELLAYNNKISDISPLKDLTNLEKLNLANNQISDISSLSGLTNLQELNLYNNQISDISSLEHLTNLQTLYLGNNQISDIDKQSLKNDLPNCSIYY